MNQSEVLAKVEAVFGYTKGESWLHTPNMVLNGRTPAEVIQTPEGICEIEKILNAIACGGVC